MSPICWGTNALRFTGPPFPYAWMCISICGVVLWGQHVTSKGLCVLQSAEGVAIASEALIPEEAAGIRVLHGLVGPAVYEKLKQEFKILYS